MAAPKGHPQWGRPKKGQKYKKTLEKEELRQVLREQVALKWGGIVEKLIAKETKYAVDQVIGRPMETIEHKGNVTIKFDE